MKEPAGTKPAGYGNIYTPHAGSMIIQVQREGGLANRTIVLGHRQVAVLRFLTSRAGKVVLFIAAATWILLAAQSVRTLPLQSEIRKYQADAHRIDSLQRTLTQLQKNYEQLQAMLGAAPKGSGVPPPQGINPDSPRDER